MPINFRQIEAFRATIEFGSATAASEVLFISQPAVSRLLADLEVELGFQLFERRARGLMPTQDAHTLYEEVKLSFVGLERIRQVANGIKEKATGNVRVVALSKYADGFVASIVGQFIKDNPGILVELESSGTAGVVQGIVSQSFDVGIASATVSDALIKTEPLFKTTALVAIHPDDPYQNRKTIKLRDLNGRRMVVLPEDSEYGSVIWKALKSEKVIPIIVGQARTHESLCRMVEAGAGLALVDKTTARDFVSSRVIFRATEPPIYRTVALIMNKRAAPSIAISTFLKTLRKSAQLANHL